jgi:hypothetical protein
MHIKILTVNIILNKLYFLKNIFITIPHL